MNYGIFIYDGTAELDFVGPLQVFDTSVFLNKKGSVFTIAKTKDPIKCVSGLKVLPEYTFENTPQIDILLIPGAKNLDTTITDDVTLSWIKECKKTTQYLTSVCTGSLILQKAGLLAGKKATTHWQLMDSLIKDPEITELPEMRYVRDGNLITSQGVSAGIDMSLWLIGEIHTPHHSRMVRKILQYDPAPPYTAHV